MVMQAQNPGWSSTPMAGNASNVDTFSRIMAMRYGGREDDIWSYLDQPGYRTTLGSPSSAPGGNWGYNTGSGSVSISGPGGGGTPSNPGGYNYRTLANTAGMTAQLGKTAANFAMDRMPGADPDLDFRFGGTPIYQNYRGKQQRAERIQNIRSRQQARADKQAAAAKSARLGEFAGRTMGTAESLQTGMQQGPMQPGAKSPLRRPTANREVNLLGSFPMSQSATTGGPTDDIWGTPVTQSTSGASTYSVGSDDIWGSGDIWDSPTFSQHQQGASNMAAGQQTTTQRRTGAAGASQRPNQPRNRGRGKGNRGFGKKL